jgi:hypothetical protein
MEWYKLLTPHLKEIAYKANTEMAWKREDALKIVSILERNAYHVFGVDVWIATNPGPTIPTPYVYDWAEGDSSSDRVAKSAAGFIAAFQWHPYDTVYSSTEPYFNIWAERADSELRNR